MARTNATNVRGIVTELREDSTISLTAAIDTANLLVTRLCEKAYIEALPDPADYEPQLEIIERWLAAHFWSCDNPKLLEETMGRAKDVIQGKVDLGLRLTHYGQQALVMDYLGTLQPVANTKPKKVRMLWLGKAREW